MSDGALDDRDQRVSELLDGQIQENSTPVEEDRDDYKEIVVALARENHHLRQQTEALEHELSQFKQFVMRELDSNGSGPTEDSPPIEAYTNIPEDEREEYLSKPDRIAVHLHDQWHEVAWQLGTDGDRRGVNTTARANVKHQPSKLKVALQRELDATIQFNDMVRGLKNLARQSGGEERTDATGRTHISGGWYEYRERTTADNDTVQRVLWRDTE
jgi:hypothetical protein